MAYFTLIYSLKSIFHGFVGLLSGFVGLLSGFVGLLSGLRIIQEIRIICCILPIQ